MTRPIYVDGAAIPVRSLVGERGLAAPRLLRAFGTPTVEPPDPALPYLFCGNGTCRDCNVAIDGIPDVPACRVPIVAGQSVGLGAGAGEPNALSERLPTPRVGPAIHPDVVVVGGGPAGVAAAESAESGGASVVLFEARALPSSFSRRRLESEEWRAPVLAEGATLFACVNGSRRPLEFGAIVIATGAHDVFPTFPGATLPGVYPMDLVERYVALGHPPSAPTLCFGPLGRAERLVDALHALGSEGCKVSSETSTILSVSPRGDGVAELAVRIASKDPKDRGDREQTSIVGSVAIGDRRVPSLALLKALGCEISYEPTAGLDRVRVDDLVRTSRPFVLAAGDVFEAVSVSEAREAGTRAGIAAAEALA